MLKSNVSVFIFGTNKSSEYMNFNAYLFIFLFNLPVFTVHGQTSVNPDSVLTEKPADSIQSIPKKTLVTAGLITGTNLGNWAFDKFVLNASYADISLNTIKSNFRTGFVWDNDTFITNLFAHPYSGGLYFNAARNNGLNFWQSVPFIMGGSLIWEFFMENEPASINDFTTTFIGGACVGEITYRISDLFIDDRTVGFERFKREALLTIISPIRGLNRLLNGDACKHRNIKRNTTLPPSSIIFYSTLGYRFMIDKSHINNDFSHMATYNIGLIYGDPYDLDNEKPYDFFSVQLSGNFVTTESLMSRANILGLLLYKDIALRKPGSQLRFGLFQHLNYYDGSADLRNVSVKPFKIAEAAAFGPGLLFKSKVTNDILFLSSAHLDAILMGGSQTDYFSFLKRDYNFGSGFSSKLNFEFRLDSKAKFLMNLEDYRIYSWTGINPANNSVVSNVQGDICNASLDVVRVYFSYNMAKHFLLTAETSYYYRKNIYKYFPNVSHGVFGYTLSVGYIFRQNTNK